ncbi:MAG: benzoyl-CoA reductase subunit C [Candidatus Neomarinimicrobiota bacterium]|nr:MAG: benzoyl-CoA reductase subunit C [Candidatus Neomarinimicrobiota bacterium]
MEALNPDWTTYEDCVAYAQSLFEDLSYSYASNWKSYSPERKIVGYLPLYVPREILAAQSVLPVGLFGAGNRLQVVRGDAYFQSYICHLPRTVVEMALGGYLDDFDGFIFPSICDVIRNLSGIFRLKRPEAYVKYLDFPQNFDPQVGGVYYRLELEKLSRDLERLNGVTLEPETLNQAIRLYNRNRALLNQLDELRSREPHRITATEFYLFRRAGQVLSGEDCNRFWQRVIDSSAQVQREPEDKIRVVIAGSFCEQPPLGLIKTIENAGCYIVDDDFQLGLHWFSEALAEDTSDPLDVLVKAYLTRSPASAAVYATSDKKGAALRAKVAARRADGVIFCAPSFCDPALLDRPFLEQALDQEHIRHFSFQYHENLGQFHVIKEQAGTFADMIKLWE